MSIVVGHDISGSEAPFYASYADMLARLPRGGGAVRPGDVSGGQGFHANLGSGGQQAAFNAKHGGDSYAGFDWQTPVNIFHGDQSQGGDQDTYGGSGKPYDTIYESQGADPMAAQAGVRGAKAGFGMLGSREQSVYDEGVEDPFNPGQRKYINTQDAGDRQRLFNDLDSMGNGNQSIDEGDYAKMFLSPEEQAQRADNRKFGNYQRQQDAMQRGRADLLGQRQQFQGAQQDKRLAAQADRQQASMDFRGKSAQQQQDFKKSLIDQKTQQAAQGDLSAAESVASMYDNLSPEDTAAILQGNQGRLIASALGKLHEILDPMGQYKNDSDHDRAVAASNFTKILSKYHVPTETPNWEYVKGADGSVQVYDKHVGQSSLTPLIPAAPIEWKPEMIRAMMQMVDKRVLQMTTPPSPEEYRKMLDDAREQIQDQQKKTMAPRGGDQTALDSVGPEDVHPQVASSIQTLINNLRDANVPFEQAQNIVEQHLQGLGVA